MAKEQDLVFKAKSIKEAKKLNSIIQQLSDELPTDVKLYVSGEGVVPDNLPKGAYPAIEFKNGFTANGGWYSPKIKNIKDLVHKHYKEGFNLDDIKSVGYFTGTGAKAKYTATKQWLTKALPYALGKDALGVGGIIPLDTRAMNEESQFKMVRQILGNLGLKNVPKPL